MMAARIEFEKEWLPKFQRDSLDNLKEKFYIGDKQKYIKKYLLNLKL
jgi:hypothetical protein